MTRKTAKQAFKYRFYPTNARAAEPPRTFGCVRLVYNKALSARTEAWYQRQERVNYNATSALLTGWKKEDDLTRVVTTPAWRCRAVHGDGVP